MLSRELLLGLLELSGIEVGVAEAVTKQVDSLGNIILEASNFNVLPFTVSRSTDTSSHLLNFLRKICLRSGLSSAGKHHTESISGSASLNCVLTRASTDVYTNRCSSTAVSFCANSDAIRQGGALEGTIVFEGFRNLASWEFAKVLHDGSLRELHMRFSGGNT